MGGILSTAVRSDIISASVKVVAKNVSTETAVGVLLTVPFLVCGVSNLLGGYRKFQKFKDEKTETEEEDGPPMLVPEEDEFSHAGRSQETRSRTINSDTNSTPREGEVVVDKHIPKDVSSPPSFEASATTTQAGSSVNASLVSMSNGLFADLMRQSLLQQVLKSDHAGKVGIGESLHNLGETLVRQGKYDQGTKTLRRSQEVRKIIIGETMASLSGAMEDMVLQLSSIGHEDLAMAYAESAEALRADPCAGNLRNACRTHQEHKPNKPILDDKLRSLCRKVDRRLNRASAEAFALSQTLKLLAQCNEYGGIDFY